jgi:hypothetical protein
MEKEMGSFINKLMIKFKCWANNVTPFSSSNLLPQFLSELNLEFKSAIMEFKLVSNELLSNPELSPKITKSLDKLSPIFVELIAAAGKIYESSEITELLEDYNLNPDAPVPIHKVATPLYSIFTKLYYIYPFQATYKKAVTAAYDAMQRLENKPQMIYNTKKKNSLNAISIVFDRYFEKLYLAIIRNENKNIPMISLYMENLLKIEDSLKPGKRKVGEDIPNMNKPKEDEKSKENAEGTEEEKVEESKSPELILGMELLMKPTIEELRKKHDPRNELAEMPDSDKALLSYLYFKEFDFEYSLVLTTKKIIIQPTLINGNKIDNKAKLLTIYELSRGCMDQFKIYTDTFKEFIKFKSAPTSNYIEYSKKLTQLEQRRGQQSRTVRATIRDYIDKTCEALGLLLNDIRGPKEIVGNIDTILSFDSVETKKKLNRKSVKEAITEAYCYTAAFASRLAENGGDLYGGIIELTPEQMYKLYRKPIENNNDDSNSIPID